jgi:hypothetical protein
MDLDLLASTAKKITSLFEKKDMTKRKLHKEVYDLIWYCMYQEGVEGIEKGKAQAAANLTSALIDLAQRAAEEGQK